MDLLTQYEDVGVRVTGTYRLLSLFLSRALYPMSCVGDTTRSALLCLLRYAQPESVFLHSGISNMHVHTVLAPVS